MNEESFHYELHDLLNFDIGLDLEIVGIDLFPSDTLGECHVPKDCCPTNSAFEVSSTLVQSSSSKKHQLEVQLHESQSESKKLRTSSSGSFRRKNNNNRSGKKPASLVQPPPPIPRSDVRYTYTRLLLSAFNSCDPVKLQEVLCTYTTEDVVSIHRSEGEGDQSNPLTSSYSRLDGRQTTIQMWVGLFKSAPDFFFQIRDTRIFHSPDWNLIVASKFDWVGTRVSDVSLAKSSEEGARVFASLPRVVVEPVFHGKEQLLVLESKPCERKEIHCSGRLLLHLTAENKISKIEFVYSGSSEARR